MGEIVLIATHDQAVHAIRQRLERPGTDQLLRGVVLRVLDIHQPYHSKTNAPDPDCGGCDGGGFIDSEPEDGGPPVRRHCHCSCPWCTGCEEPLCRGVCPTVAAIAERLDLTSSVAVPSEGRPAGGAS
ncbi:hypothetical protein [Micromonospora humidisoli]|uniref:4Fe-4S ferredoxin-type domain-containing protein n=1 Tax=Micromonospora humidisoli TaxID=2807622 RepID=A0ABS2JB80_9ACTN|nr:hypothetical protein [Micromonospora humidisoli]MBM7083619.1 hypothetical protein [Micromonospora humidisoli]